MTIWFIEGSTGEYSDHREWPVCAYTRKEDAESHVAAASAAAREISEKVRALHEGSGGWDYEAQELLIRQNQFDPDMRLDYTGTHYTCYEVELRDSFQSPSEAAR